MQTPRLIRLPRLTRFTLIPSQAAAGGFAMLFAGLLTVILGIPAQASELDDYSWLPPAALEASVRASAEASANVAAPDPTARAAAASDASAAETTLQGLVPSAATTATVHRDGFTVTDAPKPVPVPAAPAAVPTADDAAAPAAANAAVQWPFPGSVRLSGPYGPRDAPCGGCSTFHKGLDMLPGEGAPALAVADGVVREVSATDNGGFGVYAIVDHTVDGQLVSSVYAHFQAGSLQVSAGEPVGVGTHLGNVGSTGQSTGPHLHFEILIDGITPTDPYAWMSQRAGPM
ncbi:M23 family metallopeptidase [Cryobacterium sinapicolor]|uniref:M23 family metallopeptidase n=1 Tax=Cryobacterium sinapicolor TaxID=1259236 RepID=A0ABY2JFG4_9MICO|nr:M23 family metallopeptidase [Cryobacterium sinapicolor]